MPSTWPDVFKLLGTDRDPSVRSRAIALGVNFGDPAARDSLRRALEDSSAEPDLRRQALAALLKIRDSSLVRVLQNLVRHPELGGAAIRGLATYDDPATPELLIKAYGALGPAERRDVLSTLTSRKTTSRDLLAAVESGKVPRADLTADVVRQIRNLKDSELDAQLGRVWGTVRETSSDRALAIAEAKAMLTKSASQPPDRSLGRAVYAKVCQQCHTIFGVGGKVGPDLTGSNRADLDYLLSNVLDPSALIGKDYQAHVIATADGRVLTGIIRIEDKDSLTLVTANETITIPKSEVEQRRHERAVDDARRPLENALGNRDPLVGLVSRQPGAGAAAGSRGRRKRTLTRPEFVWAVSLPGGSILLPSVFDPAPSARAASRLPQVPLSVRR